MNRKEEIEKEIRKDIYLTEEEKKMPKNMQMLQYVLGIESCYTKKQVVDILNQIELQARLDERIRAKQDFLKMIEFLKEDYSCAIRNDIYKELKSTIQKEKTK